MSDVKLQHYVPRFYLNSFTDGRFLYAVRRGKEAFGDVFKTQPMKVCAERYLYEVKLRATEHEGGYLEKGIIERRLSAVEDRLSRYYRNLLVYLDAGSFPVDEECVKLITNLCFLIASFIARSPKWLCDVRGSAETLSERILADGFLSVEDLELMAAEECSGELEGIVELACLDAVLFNISEGSPLHQVVEPMLEMDCRFCVAPEGSEFITSSIPVYAVWGNELDRNPVCIYFPLSPRYAVIMRRKLDDERLVGISHVNEGAVDSLNYCLMRFNEMGNLFIARDEAILESLVAGCKALI